MINLDQIDEDDEEIDFGEFASQVSELATEIDRLQPYRDPRIELDELGPEGEFEIIFQFRISWMDRDADVEDYLDEVQQVIENSLDVQIDERQPLGIVER